MSWLRCLGLALPLCLIAAFLGAEESRAGQVDWSSSAFSVHQRSDGNSLDGSLVFELGAFADDFIPTPFNVNDWATHWRVAQRASFNPETQLFAASFVVESAEAPFSPADRGYFGACLPITRVSGCW